MRHKYSTEVRTGCVCTIARRARAPASRMPQLNRLDYQKESEDGWIEAKKRREEKLKGRNPRREKVS